MGWRADANRQRHNERSDLFIRNLTDKLLRRNLTDKRLIRNLTGKRLAAWSAVEDDRTMKRVVYTSVAVP